MPNLMSRRQFGKVAAALGAASLIPKKFWGDVSTAQRVMIRTDAPIGVVRPEFHGQFAEHLGSCVYGGLWVGENSPIPNLHGYRKQAVDYLSLLGVPVLRWPGGCFADTYHWRDGIGPAKDRPKIVNIHWGGYVEDNSFGTHEFIGLCRLIGAEPYLAGNVGSGTPEELRDWVEYCNYPSGSTLSDERARNGSPEPFHVRYWGVGNESWGCGGNMRPEEYAGLYRRFAMYMRDYPGTKLYRVACGPGGNDLRWSRGVLGGLGADLPQGFSMHYYEGGVDPSTHYTLGHMDKQLAEFVKLESAIIQQRELLDSYPGGSTVGLILDEWGVWDRILPQDVKRYGPLWQQGTMRSGIAAGLGLNLFNRQADKLAMCNIAQIVNVLQALLLTDGPEGACCIRTATYFVYELFKPHRSKTSVRVETTDSSPLGLSVSASKGKGQLIISLVNPRADADLVVDCELAGAVAKEGKAQVLHAADWNACNTFDEPDRIMPKPYPLTVSGAHVRLDLPRLSVATVTLGLSA